MAVVSLRKERDARRGKFAKDRHSGLVDGLAALVRAEFEAGHVASMLGLEGPLRHAVRGDLCLQGWHWNDANMAARRLLEMVHMRIGAERPSWNEGQREWTIEAGTLIERTFCARCKKHLPEDRRRFCSDICRVAFHGKLAYLKQADEDAAIYTATNWI